MLHQPEMFKVGVASGSVEDWSLYEIMYGECYMDTPEENPKGFEESNLINQVANLNGKPMLIHDAQDKTVVMQHSMKFLRECVKQGKQVDFFCLSHSSAQRTGKGQNSFNGKGKPVFSL